MSDIPDETEHIEQLAAIIQPALPNHCCAPDEVDDCPYGAHEARGVAEVIHAAGYVSAEVANARMADVWADGYHQGIGDGTACTLRVTPNPYRATEETL